MANLWRFPSIAGGGSNPLSAKTTNISYGSAYDDVATSLFFPSSLPSGYSLICSTGSFSLTGKILNLLTTRKVSLVNGIFGLTGNNSNTIKGFKSIADKGDFSLNGIGSNLKVNRKLNTDTGNISFSGSTISLIKNSKMLIEAGSFSLVGITTLTLKGSHILLSTGGYNMEGKSVDLLATLEEKNVGIIDRRRRRL